MAKKKGFKIGGVDISGFHFNSPVLQEAYKKWFIDMPLRAPVQVEYYDPTETSTGAVKRSPVNTVMDPYEQARGEMMSKYKYGWESGNAAVFPSRGDLQDSHNTAASRASEKRVMKMARKANIGKDGADLIKGRDSTNARIAALGGDPVGQDEGGSLWNKAIDFLLRPNAAVAEGVNRAVKDAANNDASFVSQLKAFGSGAKAGITGEKKQNFGALFKKAGLDESIEGGLNKLSGGSQWGKKYAEMGGNFASGTLGFGTDVVTDPTTYAGVGLVPKVGKLTGKVAKAGAHLSEGSKIVSRGRKTAHTFDDLTEELLTGARHVKGKVKHSEQALIYEPLRAMRNSIERTRFAEIRNELRVTDDWARIFDRGGAKNAASLASAQKQLNAAAREAAKKEAEDWMVQAVKNYQDIVTTRIKHGIGIGVAGKNGKKFTVVPAPLVSALGTSVRNVDVVQKGIAASEKYLRASAGVSQDLHNLRLQATNSGMTRAEHMGNRLRSGFAGVHRDIRETSWEQALNRNTNSGERIVVDGIEHDASEFLNTEVDILDQHVTGIATGNTPMSNRELNAMLPPGFRGKFQGGKNGVADVRESLKKWELKDGPRALWIAQQAYERANTMRSMYVSAADSFGMRTLGQGALKNAEPIFKDLRNAGWREVSEKKTHGLLKGVLFDDETAKGLEKMIDLMNNERNWNQFLRKLARITSPIKFYLTVPNPGYHIRNSIGDAFINELDNVSVTSYSQSLRVLKGAQEKYGGTSPLIMQEGNLLERAFERKNQNILFHTKDPLKKPGGTRSTGVTEAEIYAGMNQYGITQNYTLTEFANLTDNPNVMNQMGGKLKSWMINKSEFRENYFRLAHFIELVKKNPNHALTLDENMAYAAARIRKTHFDYTDFTRWEKQVASNVIPFYKWTRKAVPLMMEVMFTNPGKVIIPSKAQMALSQMAGHDPLSDDPFPNLQGMLPEWMIEAGYSPGNPASVFGGGGPGMFAVPDPFHDTFSQTLDPAVGGAKQGPGGLVNFLIQQSNPALKVPYELFENKNSFLSRGGDRVPIYREESKKKDLANYFISQFPYARQANRAFAGEADKRNFGALTSQMLGIYNQQLTPSIVRGELYRQEQLASDRWLKMKEELSQKMLDAGVKPPETTKEWDDFLTAYAKKQGRVYRKPK